MTVTLALAPAVVPTAPFKLGASWWGWLASILPKDPEES